MTFGMGLVALLAVTSLIFIVLAVMYKQMQRQLFDQLENEGVIDAFTVVSIKYLTTAMRPEDSTSEEKDVLFAELKAVMDLARPAYEAMKTADKYMFYSIVSVVLMLVAALAVGLGL